MTGDTLKVLLIEDNPDDSFLIKELFSENRVALCSVDIADRLSQGLECVAGNSYDVVLLDLGLPDSQGLDTFAKLNAVAGHLPIVVLSGLDDDMRGLASVHKGAQDYLVKGQVDGNSLVRSLRYAIERKKLQEQKELWLNIMGLLNKNGDQSKLISEILLLIKDFSGCEAMGIRLKAGDDYPYYQTSGFLTGHVELENCLCCYDENGEMVRDFKGDPVLECMCGNIIQGRFDSSLPFFTLGGSFWSNCTTVLLASTTEEDRQARTRNRCNGEGYESVALIPLKGENGNIGLLQLNDTRRNRFTAELIMFYEGIAQSIGIVLTRKHAEEALRESEEKYRLIVENSRDIIFVMNLAGQFIYISPSVSRMLGYSPADLLGRDFMSIVHPDDLPAVVKMVVANIEKGEHAPDMEFRILSALGEWRWQRGSGTAIRDGNGVPLNFTGIASDITERKKAEEALRNSVQRFNQVAEVADESIWEVDKEGLYNYISPSTERILGYTADELVGRKHYYDLFAPEVRDDLLEPQELFEIKKPFQNFVNLNVHKNGGRVYLETSGRPILDKEGNLLGYRGVNKDITERKKAEDAIIRSKLLLQKVIDSTPDWMYVKDFEHKYLLVNKSFAEAQDTTPQNMIGRADTEFFSEELCLGDPVKGISGYHDDDNQAFQGHMVHNPRNLIAWADGSLHIYDTYKIPLTDQSGQIYGALIYSRDITRRAKAEEERKVAIESLRRSLRNVIATMARVVEMRDPYTAGHQRRVAALAGAIALEMDLEESRVEHLVMAATIHDIGKMYVPSDILSKPGKLADIEFSLMKTHAQGSFEIIKNIEFSQPVALMALQHHERLDGSGYPNRLKGDAILTESKILAVADVVEAMSSHRPYRAALGIDMALEEISKNKGKLYDPDVVDACLKLFKEQLFKFEE